MLPKAWMVDHFCSHCGKQILEKQIKKAGWFGLWV